jgi:predicted permease
MTWLRVLFARLRALFAKQGLDGRLAEELQSHFEMLVEQNVQRGMATDQARREAKLALGGPEQIKESVRDQRGLPLLESLFSDIRYGARMLRKSPGFTAIAVLTLALGIGANSTIFTLTYAVILKSLPVPNPQQLVRYTFRSGEQDLGLSGPVYDSLRKHETSVDDVLAWSSNDFSIEDNGSSTTVQGALASGNAFHILQLQPAIGRPYTEMDDAPGGGPNGYEALISFPYWKQHFAASSNAIGGSLHVNGKTATIVGVLPEGFEGLVANRRADVVLPLAFEAVTNAPNTYRQHPGSFWLTVMGRLKPGESLRTARANLQATEEIVRNEGDPTHNYLIGVFSKFQLGVESGSSGRSSLRVNYSQPLIALEILVGLLLLLCCANTALLVLARVSGRVREFAVRSALGAPRHRLFRQVLSEVILIAGLGLVAGIAMGWWGADYLVSMLAAIGEPPPLELQPQLVVLAFTGAISVLSALVAGVWPAVRASRVSPMLGLKGGASASFSKGIGRWIVPAQVSVSVTLLVAASLLGGSFVHLLADDSGFRSHGVVIAIVDLSAAKLTAEISTREARQTVEAIEQTPGLQAASAMSSPPIYGWWSGGAYFSVPKGGETHQDMTIWPETVTTNYFQAMGTPILKGRGFTRSDNTGEQVCVLSAGAARFFFPNEDPLGQMVYSGKSDGGKAPVDPSNPLRVIGVAADARFHSLREEAPRMIYSLARKDEFDSGFFVVARGTNVSATTTAIRDAVRQVAPSAEPPTIFTFDRLVAMHLRRERMLTFLSSSFAAVALLLTAMGLYGLLIRSVVVRTKEIGVRLALGARPRDALALVLSQGMRLVVVGALIGSAAALAVTRLLGTLLFGISAANPLVFVGVLVAVFGVALAASCIPAWRAMRVDPIVALRYE